MTAQPSLFDEPPPEDLPALLYAGTSGFSGTESSESRMRFEDESGRTTARQQFVIALAADAMGDGITVHEVEAAMRRVEPQVHHGTASGVLSNLHGMHRLDLLKEKRGGCQVYVLPESVLGRVTVPHMTRALVCADCEGCRWCDRRQVTSVCDCCGSIEVAMRRVPSWGERATWDC